MGGHVGLPLLMLLLLWGQRSWGSSCPKSAYLGADGECYPCTTCEGEQAYEKECSKTANAVCTCIRCGKCGIGEEWTEEGCQSCPEGTFNNQISGKCQPWTPCPSNKTLTPGTAEKDAICMPESKDPAAPLPTAPDTTVGIGINTCTTLTAICVGLLLLLLLSIFFSLWAKKFPAVFKKLSLKPLAQEVEDCSCRYPEEEEGGGSDISGLKGELLENIP